MLPLDTVVMKSCCQASIALVYLRTPGYLIVLLDPVLNHTRNLEVVLFEIQEVPIPLDPALTQLDPVSLDASLVQIFDRAMVVSNMRACSARDRHVWHFRDVRKLTGWGRL